MGCNCGGQSHARRTITVYRLTMPDGTHRDYRTPQEADAANRRTDNGGTITVVTLTAPDGRRT
ncbi:hypothetical protein [Streptomyces sp. GbtcB6]|uniref:DUF7196 family protein n=1 Tax=Streptomyces sp. GbtcB6 TaxID=2824751 RepID=UPI001C30D912|nr:hypothetical protein [Streptomyces sp. GbtcB6]